DQAGHHRPGIRRLVEGPGCALRRRCRVRSDLQAGKYGDAMSVAVSGRWTPWRSKPSVLPGFGITLGFAITYLSLIVLIPLAVLVGRASELGLDGIWQVATTPRVLAAL